MGSIPMIRTKYRQDHIAKKLGVSQGTVSNWLTLKVKPTGLGKQALENQYPTIAKQIEREWKQKE